MSDLSNIELYTERINKSLNSIRDNFLRVGYYLREINERKVYKEKYSSFEDYVNSNYDFGRSQAYNFISLCERFSARDKEDNLLIKIDDKYSGYNMSQLTEMLSLNESYIESWVKPDSSIREIREIKRNIKKAEKNKKSVQMSGRNEKSRQEKNSKQIEIGENEEISDVEEFGSYILKLLKIHESVIEDSQDKQRILDSLEKVRGLVLKEMQR